MRFFIITAVTVALVYQVNGQICNCESNFNWVRTTFEENDAGFKYHLGKKGQEAYDLHNQMILGKVRSTNSLIECTEILNEWLNFFRSGHIGVELMDNRSPSLLDEKVKVETWTGDISQFEEYINSKKDADLEGIWKTRGFKIGIKKEGANYIGFVIESEIARWNKQGLVRFRIDQVDDKQKTTFYSLDYLPMYYGAPELIGKNYLRVGNYMPYTRVSPNFSEDPLMERYVKSKIAIEPYLEELNQNTLYLRISSFEMDEKKAINKVISSNRKKILKTENLIIDLRDNDGGVDDSYYELLPLIYTNPIQAVVPEFLSTQLNNQLFLNMSNSKEINSSTRKEVKEAYDILNRRLGEFVNLYNDTIVTYRQKSIYQYPKNVGIIIDRESASATEEFLLLAKQSTKVKLFGTNSSGCLDISNIHVVESPCKEFVLTYSISRSLRIPYMVIDDIGIPPDYYIDETIPKHMWVEFVNNILNQLKN